MSSTFSFSLCVLCALCANPFFVSAWERRTLVRHVFYVFRTPPCPPCDPIFFLSKHANLKVGVPKNFFSMCPVFFKTGTKAYRAVAKRKGAYAAMLVLTVPSVFSVFSVFSV